MLRSATRKAMRLVRGLALFGGAAFGLALVVGLTAGAASMAFGANGGNFILGKNNAATALTRLTGNVNGPAMQVQNTNAGTNDTALNLNVQPGEAPMRVDSDARVTDLNADKLDGNDSSAFAAADSAPLWALVGQDDRGRVLLLRSRGATGLRGTGTPFVVSFDRDVSRCAYSASIYGDVGTTVVLQGADPRTVEVTPGDLDGTPRPRPFFLVVNC